MQQPHSPSSMTSVQHQQQQQHNSGGSTTSSSLSPSQSSMSLGTHEQPLEEKYADTSLYPLPVRFEKLIPLDERYITHSTFLKNKTETSFIGLLTSAKFYSVDPDTNKQKWIINLFDIHSIEGDESIDPKMLKIVYHIRPTSGTSGTSTSSGNLNSTIVGGGGGGGGTSNGGIGTVGNSLSSSTDNMNPSPPDSPNISGGGGGLHRIGQLTATALKKATNASDSNFIGEKVFIAESEDIRDQCYSSNHLYRRPQSINYISTVKQNLELGKVKWSFPITALKNIQVFKSPTNLIVLNLDNKENSKVKDTQQFILRDIFERNFVVNELRRLYNRSTKQHLTKEEKDEPQPKKSTFKIK
ncbi:hypothetical protein PPL_02175 [Heterostelium album PN500]|uniref:Uncharacterized protein n=1 Tax=Heterostelium pallidum (strain ATCC 26659 / Pp 5 / PN500) TaxID=670386 RepID=D3B1K1_HETP5|nr:hypothetical protein PPL_02175 [Heterostelium album PN500]EFA85175.1 hypothetical protein PPL_02175 [Heterostelium album PN500]|eukprot:XP_020437284.1 hypothetical protein PPL_02175 [Heterostelium album PN500]